MHGMCTYPGMRVIEPYMAIEERAYLKLDRSCPQHRKRGALVAIDDVLRADGHRPPVHPLYVRCTKKCWHLEHTLQTQVTVCAQAELRDFDAPSG